MMAWKYFVFLFVHIVLSLCSLWLKTKIIKTQTDGFAVGSHSSGDISPKVASTFSNFVASWRDVLDDKQYKRPIDKLISILQKQRAAKFRQPFFIRKFIYLINNSSLYLGSGHMLSSHINSSLSIW